MGIISESRAKVKPGDRFGRWTVLGRPFSYADGQNTRHTFVVVECNCGLLCVRQQAQLMRPGSISCGCHVVEISTSHGLARRGRKRSRLYRTWAGMLTRTTNPKTVGWKYYGGRGISVCSEWRTFEPFMAWAYANGYRDDLQIDRRDNDGNYEPGNCRWVTRFTQSRNRSCTRTVEAFGEKKLMCEWAEDERCKVCYATLARRMDVFKWPPEKAIATPSRKSRCER